MFGLGWIVLEMMQLIKCFGIYNIESNGWDIKCLNNNDDNSHKYSKSSMIHCMSQAGWDTNHTINEGQSRGFEPESQSIIEY